MRSSHISLLIRISMESRSEVVASAVIFPATLSDEELQIFHSFKSVASLLMHFVNKTTHFLSSSFDQ